MKASLPVLIVSLFVSAMVPALADDSANAGAGSDSSKAGAGSDSSKTAPARQRFGHRQRIPNKREVLNLSSLTEKQKTQIQSIYSESEPKLKDLAQQLIAARRAEWKQVQGVLTKEQLSELGAPDVDTSGASGTGSGAD